MAALVVLGAVPAPVSADDFRLVPAAFVKQEFNDNVLFTSTGARSSFITTLSAGCTMLENTERLSTKLNVRLDGLLYSADSSLDGLEQRYGAQAAYLLTPLLRLGASAAFSRESRPDRLVETTGLIVRQDSSHQTYSLTGDATFTEKATGQLVYGYDWADYHDASVSNFDGHTVKAALAYDLGGMVPLLKLRAVAGFSSFRYTASTVQSYSLTGGLSYPLHELWSVQGDIGARLTHADFASGPFAQVHHSSDSPGFVVNLSAFYRGESDTAALTVSRDIQNAAGRSGAVQATAFYLQLNRRFSYELTGALQAGYYLNVSDREQFSDRPIDDSTVRVSPMLRYELSRDLALDLSYEYALVENHQARTESGRNKVYICLTFQRAVLE